MGMEATAKTKPSEKQAIFGDFCRRDRPDWGFSGK